MATRSISTYQPAVPCDVCGRNLLRGEQPDVFLAAGQRRMVCELCQSRAAHEGWLREADGQPRGFETARGRRGRTLMGRLRTRRAVREDEAYGDELEVAAPGGDDDEPGVGLLEEPVPGAFVDGEWVAAGEPEPVAEPEPPRPARGRSRATRAAEAAEPRSVHAVPTNADFKAARALEVFNASEHPRRIAGVARSLGVPEVTARPITPDSTVMTIVVAWELCWYRYEVDLGDERSGTRLLSQGAELDELDELDRVANGTADERGELRMLAL